MLLLRDAREEPYSWDKYAMEFHKNGGTWCADNALEEIAWANKQLRGRVLHEVTEERCACHLLKFRVDEVLDPGPLIVLRTEPTP